MCELVSAATMATVFGAGAPALTAMDVIGVAGAAMGAMGSISSGNAKASAMRYNAQVAQNDAIAKQQQAQYEADRQAERARQALGVGRVNAAASGTTMEGSPLDVMAQNAQNSELDRLAILYNGQLGANASMSQATLDTMQAGTAQTSGYLGAGTSLLMGAYKVGSKFSGIGQPLSGGTPGTGGMVNTDTGYGPMRIAPRPSFIG